MRSLPGLLLAAFACGVCLLQTRAALPPFPVLIVVAGIALACVTSRLQVSWLAIGAVFIAGFGYAAWRAEVRLAQSLPAQWEGTDIELAGVVDDLPSLTARGARFAFAVERVVTPHAVVPPRISLAWYAPRDEQDAGAAPVVRAGERWRLHVRLRRPHGNVNPGGFDLEAWLLQQDLRATGYVVEDSRNLRTSPFAGRFIDRVQRARERIRERILHALAGKPYAGVIAALTIGDQRAIPEAQWTVFNRTGISHLVSISGLHVTVFATFAGGIAFALARRSARLTTRVPARKIAAAVGMFAAGGYTLLAGAEVPAVRTFAMLAIAACGLWLSRPGTAGIVWLWALATVLAWDPWAPLTPGFWLSYGAVALLLYASVGRLRPAAARGWRARLMRVVGEGARAQWVVTVGLTPLTLALFGQASLVSPIANAIAIPAVTLVVVPPALSGIVMPFDLPFELAHAALAPLMHVLEGLAALPTATWQQHAPAPWTIVAGCLGTLWLVAPRAVPGRWLGLLWLAPILLVRPPPLVEGTFRLTLLDVGQGLAAVIETARHTLVYDTGPAFGDTSDAGGRIVAPFLRAGGMRRIDGLIVSHQDLDHSGGALSLLDAVPVGWFASSLPDDHPIVERAARKAHVVRCLGGQAWAWDGVAFAVLHPASEDYVESRKSNDRSCVLRVQSPHGSALLTGDVEAASEALLVRTAQLRSDVVLVPHHGSRTSSTYAFIRAVDPSVALIAAGYRNRFGHPRPDIVARYANEAIAVSRTDLEGALTIVMDARRILQPAGARAVRARYWLDQPQREAPPLE